MIRLRYPLMLLALITLSGCSAQRSTMQNLTKDFDHYHLELTPIRTTEANVYRWDVFLTDTRTDTLMRLDTLTVRQPAGAEAMWGEPKRKASIAGGLVRGDTLYAVLLLDRESSLRVYPITAGKTVRGATYPAGPVGIGTYLNTGYARLSATLVPAGSRYLFISRKGGTEASGGRLPMQLFDKSAGELYQLSFSPEAARTSPGGLAGAGGMELTELGKEAARRLPELLGQNADAGLQLAGVIDETSAGLPRNDGLAYFIFTSETRGSLPTIVRYDFSAGVWVSGPYERQLLRAASAMPWDR